MEINQKSSFKNTFNSISFQNTGSEGDKQTHINTLQLIDLTGKDAV